MSTHNLQPALHPHRIGTVSRLAGVPVSTLRMWEERHAAFTPGKTGGRHRLYGEEDVARARLLRQLTESGHSIGGIAKLPMQQLQQMLAQSRGASPASREAPQVRRLTSVVVGPALATRIDAAAWSEAMAGGLLDVRQVFATLDEAVSAPPARLAGADVLLVRFNAVQPAVVEQLLALQGVLQARHGVLLYNFAAQPTLASLRDAGFIVRREPVDDAELAELLRSITWAHADDGAAEPRAAVIPARRFSDAQLAAIAASPGRMLCECPRHLSDLISQLASFEEYSAACLNESTDDAHVHARLRSVAGSARAMFEGALQLVLAHNEGRRDMSGNG